MKISYYNLNELANAAKNEVILDSLYTGAVIQLESLESIIKGKNTTIKILETDIISSQEKYIEIQDTLNIQNMNLRNQYKKELRKSKLKKWFWIIPTTVIGYILGGL